MDFDIEQQLEAAVFEPAGDEPIFDDVCKAFADFEAVQALNPLVTAQLAFS